MPIEFQIQEVPEGLIISVRKPRSWLTTLWGTAITGTVFYFFVLKMFHLTPSVLLIASSLIALGYGIFDYRTQNVTTTVTKLEATVCSTPKKWFGLNTSIAWTNVTSLSFRPEMSQGEGETLPSGLYAEKEWGAACLVPYIDQAQTELLIAAIEKRFPHLPFATTSSGSSLFRDDLVRLNLK